MKNSGFIPRLLFGKSPFDFHWFLAGPLVLSNRFASRALRERYEWCVDKQSGFLWRAVLRREFEKRGVGVLDPYSSPVARLIDIFGKTEGMQIAAHNCDGVIAALLPYHWNIIPDTERNLSIALDSFHRPFVAYAPEVLLSRQEKKTMKEVKRFMSIIPACMRIVRAIIRAERKGIPMPTTTEDLSEKRMSVTVQCDCGETYEAEVIAEASGRRHVEGQCPNCGKQFLDE